MDLKPSDIFIGVIEFFSVMLPGALLTYFLTGMFYNDVFGAGKVFPEPPTDAVRWIVFLLITYVIGNIIFMIAAFLDNIYDKVLRKPLFQSNYDLRYKTAWAVQRQYIDTDRTLDELLDSDKITDVEHDEILKNPEREILNTYKWAQHFLLFKNPDALADIRRTEADSKFFRSLVVTFLIIAVLLLAQAKNAEALFFLALSILCLYRYGDFRRKATEKAYEIIITYRHLQTDTRRLQANQSFEADAPETISSSELKQDLTEDFLNRHRELILFLTRGFKNNLKQIIVDSGIGNKNFISDKNDSWCCLQGNGVLNVGEEDELVETRLIPNAIIPIMKDSSFSFITNNQEPIEILVIET
jgi:hypothetical protein